MAVALGRWEDVPVIAMRWNGTDDNPVGHPQSRGLPTWFIIDREGPEGRKGAYTDAIVEALPASERALVRNFIPKT